MTREAFKAILDPLVLALRADFDLPTWTVWYQALKDVPPALLASAVARALKTATFMPRPGELRTWAEDARRALIQAHPYEGCCECQDMIGWRSRLDQRAVEPCPCFGRWQEKLAALGAGLGPLALPAGMEQE